MLRKTLLFTLLLVLLAACAPQATPTPAALTFTDGLGREVKLEGPAQRVISLAPSLTEVFFAVGAGSQVVGRDDFSDYPVEAQNVASIGSTFSDLNTEAILALEPDLVVAAEINTPEQVKSLEDLGIAVYYFANPVSFKDMFDQLELAGTMTGHKEEATALVESLTQRVEAVEAAVAGVTEKPTAFYEIDGTDPVKPWTTGPGTFMDTMITMAGGVNIGGVLSDQFAQISVEEIVSQDPDFIILGDTAFGVTVESIGARAGWSDLTAVKEGKIFPFDDNLASRPGPRLVDGLEDLLAILHPELVPTP
ncbi:MAG: cobalamin-binding protein [Anaerolineae bacterium]|nr:cobalamin-binding protein [Anaerolineae bacterium]MCI0609186.1 cobalamin-binding protein [Anaerolineae bacterium]